MKARKKCLNCGQIKTSGHFYKNKSKKDGLSNWCVACSLDYSRIYRSIHIGETRLKSKKWRKEHPTEYAKLKKKHYLKHRKHYLEYKKQYYLKHREKMREKGRKRAANIPTRLYDHIRVRAKKMGVPINISIEDIIVPKFCPVLGIKLKVGHGHCSSNSPTVDRIDNKKGYVKGNIIVVSHKANTIKNNATIEELGKAYHFYKKLADQFAIRAIEGNQNDKGRILQVNKAGQ